eukprot:m.204258 g.204258  ORF g.204258 m.204258 type:complete len:432 (+) comp25311_c0_seq1:39-1334(+)
MALTSNDRQMQTHPTTSPRFTVHTHTQGRGSSHRLQLVLGEAHAKRRRLTEAKLHRVLPGNDGADAIRTNRSKVGELGVQIDRPRLSRRHVNAVKPEELLERETVGPGVRGRDEPEHNVVGVNRARVGDRHVVLHQRGRALHRAELGEAAAGVGGVGEQPADRPERGRVHRGRGRVGERGVRETKPKRHDRRAGVEAVRPPRVGSARACRLVRGDAVWSRKRGRPWPHPKVKDGDFVGVRRGVDGLHGPAGRRHFAEEDVAEAERGDRGLADVEHSADLVVGQHIGEIERCGSHQHQDDGLLGRRGHVADERDLRRREGDGLGIVALPGPRQVGADHQHDRVGRLGHLDRRRDLRHVGRQHRGHSERAGHGRGVDGHSVHHVPEQGTARVARAVVPRIRLRQVGVGSNDKDRACGGGRQRQCLVDVLEQGG